MGWTWSEGGLELLSGHAKAGARRAAGLGAAARSDRGGKGRAGLQQQHAEALRALGTAARVLPLRSGARRRAAVQRAGILRSGLRRMRTGFASSSAQRPLCTASPPFGPRLPVTLCVLLPPHGLNGWRRWIPFTACSSPTTPATRCSRAPCSTASSCARWRRGWRPTNCSTTRTCSRVGATGLWKCGGEANSWVCVWEAGGGDAKHTCSKACQFQPFGLAKCCTSLTNWQPLQLP